MAGGDLDLFATRSSGFVVRRTERHVRHHRSDPVVSVSLQPEGVHRAEAAGRRRLLGLDDICVRPPSRPDARAVPELALQVAGHGRRDVAHIRVVA
ncbi:hypothetical protein [Streptomyces sp. NPDC051636]|uniref:hypothetical protein n=1 Tax=Streptomyces sp. NPDC051636 TaxID=3365663 RepID=UPI0037A71702